ncbi:MAG TPA: response regulator [Candidatus Limnocylindria bacterium]|nr:response regulator [Candidatus Limnocylindria bacterium]
MKDTPGLILATEDEESDRLIMELVYERTGLPNRLVILSDGQEAVNYLQGNGIYHDRTLHPLPALLLLDLKMPRMNGFDVLAWLATQPQFKDLPTVMFSASAYDQDIRKARELGARDYFVKPLEIQQFVQILCDLHARWLAGGAA